MPQTDTQKRLGQFEEYLRLKPLQKRALFLSIDGLTLPDEEIRQCCNDAAGLNAAECQKIISAFLSN